MANGMTSTTFVKIIDEPYIVKETVRKQIEQTLILPEMGGILGTNEKNLVTAYHHDTTGRTTTRTYTPDITSLNEVIIEWSQSEIDFIGFVHSHPPNKTELSIIDIRYAEKIKVCCEMTEILMLLYIPADKSFYQYVL